MHYFFLWLADLGLIYTLDIYITWATQIIFKMESKVMLGFI